MKGNKQVIERLNVLLADELSAIGQYMIHAEMCANWGFERLHESVEKRAITEMKHAQKLISRILFLEGQPSIGLHSKVEVGQDIKNQFDNDRHAEEGAVKIYNSSIQLAEDNDDIGTAELLRGILIDEEEHLDWLETQLGLIEKLGIENYLQAQTT